MAKLELSDNKSGKDKNLSNTSSDDIKSAGTGIDKNKDSKFNKKGSKKFKGSKGEGKHFKKKTNDPSWYVANPSIVRDVANLPFAVYNGVTYNNFWNTIGRVDLNSTSNFQQTVPGVAVYKYTPWYGTATPTSALNLTMRALYSFVRHVNSGKTNYEAPDLMMYVMAMDSVYLLIHEIKRMIRLAYLYVLENRDIPDKVFAVLGVDYSDLVGNLANYRAQLNTRIAKANSLAVPANFNLFKRRAVMGSVVLTDEPNRPTQLIVPVADGYYMFSGTRPTGSTLEYRFAGSRSQFDGPASHTQNGGDNSFIKTKTKVNDYFQLLDNMLSVLLADEDINIMSGDIIKAYGDNLYKLPFIEENEIQDIIHDENLLLQFTNSTVLDIPTASFTRFLSDNAATGLLEGANLVRFENAGGFQEIPIITQKDGSIVARCTIDSTTDFSNLKRTTANSVPLWLLNNFLIDTTDANAISPENILEWTRLTMCFVVNRQNPAYHDLEAGVEIGLGWIVGQPLSTFTLPNAINRNVLVDQTVSTQWFQFGRRNSIDAKVQMPAPSTISSGIPLYITYVVNEQINQPFSTQNTTMRKFNTMYASKFIEGLSYGPRSYEVGSFIINGGRLKVYGDMAIGKLGEKTALASPYNISAMHDAALLGLISSPYVTTSK